MNNAELIEALRYCAMHECCDESVLAECKYSHKWKEGEDCNAMLLTDAADALEAADKRIKELEAQLPKEGEWIDIKGTMFAECSVCGNRHYGCNTPYCDMCGAKMRTVTDCHTLEEGER